LCGLIDTLRRKVRAEGLTRITFDLRVAVLSGRHPGQDSFAGRNAEAVAGDVRPAPISATRAAIQI